MSITNSISSLIPTIRGLIKDQKLTNGRDTFSYDTDNKFNLSESFIDEDSIQVFKNSELATSSDWTYDSDSNRVIVDYVDSGDDLEVDDIVVITYSYYKKYSDTEIIGYVNSALTYFVQHKYHKVFEVNSSNQIICVNDIKPIVSELYFICLISAILIDPQNIEINTPEFKLTANRSDSDQKQIEKAFTQFKRMLGNVNFEKTIWFKQWN